MKVKMPDINLVAFDPGETTGIVEIEEGDLVRSRSMTYPELIEAMAFENNPVVWDWGNSYSLWVIEDFITYPWLSNAFSSVLPARLLGVLEVMALRYDVEIVYQLASASKFITNEMLREFGWWDRLRNKHEKDAARHAAYYMLRTGCQKRPGKPKRKP